MVIGHHNYSLKGFRGLGQDNSTIVSVNPVVPAVNVPTAPQVPTGDTSVPDITAVASDLGSFMTDQYISGIPNYVIIGGGILLWYVVSGISSSVSGFQRKRKSASATSAKKRAAALRAQAKSLESF